MDLTLSSTPRLYHDLVWLWPAAIAAAGFDTTVERCELSDAVDYFVIIGRRH